MQLFLIFPLSFAQLTLQNPESVVIVIVELIIDKLERIAAAALMNIKNVRITSCRRMKRKLIE